jgi:putative phage-type endonuclease
MGDLTAKTKTGYAASRKNYLSDLLIERMTGEPVEGYESAEMRRGRELEPKARSLYELTTGNTVDLVGLVLHPRMDYAGASPDGLAGDDGTVEIKCPNTATHIETLRTQTIPRKYRLQMQWVMECTGRSWCDYISYDPRMRDPRLTLYVQRVGRDEETIAMLRAEVEQAEAELQSMQAEIEQLAEQIA